MLQDKSPQKPHNVHNLANSPSRFNRKYVARHPPVRQCTLVRTVPPINMPSQIDTHTEMKYKKEVERVSEKVSKTRHEIEELKAQLQQLINEGIAKTDFTETKQNVPVNVEEKPPVDDDNNKINEIKAKTFKDNVADTFKGDIIEKKLTPSILKPPGPKQTNREENPKKVRHYDQEVAREYIKKQREKRKEEINKKNKKDATASSDLKRQRLQQLREKSLRLLSKNIELNRARSRSRSRETVENKIPETPKYNSVVSLNVSSPSLENLPKPLHPQLQNITVRSQQCDNVTEAPNDNLRQISALKIQAAFRGHKQRKIYNELKKKNFEEPEQILPQQTNLHIPAVMPYPYNFINAVKRKLNLVTRQTVKVHTVDVAIQSSLAGDLKSPNLDLKSFLSHKCLELEPLTLFNKNCSSKRTVNVENGCVSESDTSKDIPELSSENTISESLQRRSVQSTKRSHSSDTDPKLTISVEGVKKLKLRQPKLVDSEISEHLNEATERISSSRDSIIASNKCNYVQKSNPAFEEKSISVVSTEPAISNQKTYMKEKEVEDVNTHSFDNKENVSQTTTAQDKSNKSSRAYSSNFTSVTTDIPMLEPPKVSLKTTLPVSSTEDSDAESVKKLITNVTLRSGEKSTLETKAKTNEIHLKFEAELHLLNDFNDSLRRVMAVEKSLLELHDKKNEAALNYETRDTQTSIAQQNQVASINYSRGSDVTEAFSINKDLSLTTTSLDLSPFNSPIEESNSEDFGDKQKLKIPNVLSGISLEMFEQLIKDEDARIENLKAILKIREKSLVDRTKGELAWLEVQKKHLRDAGQLQEISAIKKKQRGLLIKLEHERHEMQRLKQMQKAASKERKSVLREQRNMIKAQLAAGNTVTRIKKNTREQKRQSGPFKVYNIQSNNDSIVSETSVTRKSSITEEVVSATSNRSHSIVSHISEELVLSEKIHIKTHKDTSVRTENVKRSLLMREAALQKRKKVAEELLQWHQRLLEEERKITELELAASAIINQVPIAKDPDESMSAKQTFKGSQLNQLWLSLTGRPEKKFKDEELYNMSQTSLEKFCRNAKKYERVRRTRGVDPKKTVKSKTTIPIEDVTSENNEYLSDFESASSVSEHCQSSTDSTLSNHDVTTVTEITKPNSNKSAKAEDSTASEFVFTNGDVVKSISDERSASDGKHASDKESKNFSNVHTEHQQISKTTVDQILSEIDKYLESQSNSSEKIKSSLGDGTIASKSISKDASENAQISTSICDKTQVIDEVSDVNVDLSSVETETVGTEEFNDDKDVIVENISKIVPEEEDTISINENSFQDVPEENVESIRIVATATISSDAVSKISGEVPEFTSNKDEVVPIEESSIVNGNRLQDVAEESIGAVAAAPISSTVTNDEVPELNDASKSNKTERDITVISELNENDESSICELNGPSQLTNSKVSTEELCSENLSKPSDQTNLISFLEESNKSSGDTTVSTVSELNSGTKQTVDEDKTSTYVDEERNCSGQTRSNIFNELPYKSFEISEPKTIDGVPKAPNCDLQLKQNSTSSYVTEIYEDPSPKRVTEPESENLPAETKKSNDDNSPSETIDSITELEEDEDPAESNRVFEPETSENKVSSINDVSSIREDATDTQESSSDESIQTDPRLLLSYGYVEEHKDATVSNLASNEVETKEKATDIKKRVSEILADANISSPRGDRSPRLQDFYVTAYDVVSPETTSPVEDVEQSVSSQNVFGSDEVEELLKKQLEIEQEIKAIQQQQQKEQLPYLYVREIPNKPPPPYTPPLNPQSPNKGSVLPSGDGEITTITSAAAQILYKAAASNTIKDVALTENAKKCLELKNNVEGQCYEFLFDLCKEFALEHYKQFEPETGPSWTHLQKQTKLAIGRPLDQTGLQKCIDEKVKQVLGHEVVNNSENTKHKWSGKKRDHVDELLVVECQAEEAEWTNYDRDELVVKDELTKEIMNMLLSETGQVLNNILSKKKYLC